MQLEIDDDLVTKIIVKDLQKAYICQQTDISRLLKSGKALQKHEVEDLYMFIEVGEALARVLQYYMYRPDADMFIDEHKFPQR